MRMFNRWTMQSAGMLAFLLGFVACVTDGEDMIPSGVGESVKTQFTLSIPAAKIGGRMTAENTQQNQQFLGMKNMVLLPFETLGEGERVLTETPYQAAPTNAMEPIGPNFTGGTAGTENPTMKAKLYKDMDIPVGTTAFLFYGESALEGTEFQTGKMLTDFTNLKTAGDISFAPVPMTAFDATSIVAETGGDKAAKDMLSLLNGPLLTHITPEAGGEEMYWIDFFNQNQTGAIGKDYERFKSNNAGSARSVLPLLQEIYNNMSRVAAPAAGVTNDEKAFAQALMAELLADHGDATLWCRPGTNTENEPGKYVLEYKNAFTFPENLKLPDGAIQVDASSGKFVYATTKASGTGIEVAELNNYVYPASLYYQANSPIAVSQKENDLFTSGTDWTAYLKSFDNGGAASMVRAATKSIAMIDPIQYAVAVMESRVKIGDGVMSLQDSKGNPVVPNFQLTGVLVGGQQMVDWKFEPDESSSVYYTLYDCDLPDGEKTLTTAGVFTEPNYTLVLPTQNGENLSGVIKVALEFQNNNSKFFHGINNKIIPAGSKFYLVGVLDVKSLEAAGGGVADANGIVRVFLSDHKTVANFTIGEKSLAKAYNVVPDLRSHRLEMGMMVDLEWKEGLDFGEMGI